MNILVICLLIAAILPYLTKLPVAVAMHRSGGYNNNYPREQASQLQGFGARAWAAHKNSFESLLIFATAAITAIATRQVTEMVETLAIVYIISRIAYHVMYLMNLATLRSLVWAVGVLCSFVILGSCIKF